MSPRPIRGLVAVLVLGFTLAAPWAAVAQPSTASWSSVPPVSSSLPWVRGFLARLWDKAGCLIDPSGSSNTSRTKEGCGIDPDGRRSTTVAQGKEGCGIDPSGTPAANREKAGCGIDPNGQRTVSARNKAGCGIDPSGRCIP